MNWWNTCGYLLGYRKNKRVSLKPATHEMKLMAILLKEYYRHYQLSMKNEDAFRTEIKKYISGESRSLKQLFIFSMPYRRNDSQYFYLNGKPTWIDCTSRATYAWKYIAQNGYVDFDGKVRVIDGEKIIEGIRKWSVYPDIERAVTMFASGENMVKKEIFSQKNKQATVAEWIDMLGIKVIPCRRWLFDVIGHVKTDPYKKYELRLYAEGRLTGNNELLYGFKTSASYIQPAMNNGTQHSTVGRVSSASHSSDASNASNASGASRASDASNASNASGASHSSDAGSTFTSETRSWFYVDSAIGAIDGLDHPPVFLKNKFGIAGHWKIDKDVVAMSKIGWFDPFMGHGKSPLYAKRVGKNFVGIEINPESMHGYLLPIVQDTINQYSNLTDTQCTVEIRHGDSAVFYPDLVGRFDLCYTSPPYFNFEDYGFHNKEILSCADYDEYHKRVTIPVFSNVKKYLIQNGILALQTEKSGPLQCKWIDVISSLGFSLISASVTGQEKLKYSTLSKRDQTLLIFRKID